MIFPVLIPPVTVPVTAEVAHVEIRTRPAWTNNVINLRH